MISRPKRQAGFSLVELLVAAFIMAVGILGLTMLQVFAIRTNNSSRSLNKALGVATRTLETVAMEGRRSMLWKTEGRSPTTASYLYVDATKTVTRYITQEGESFPETEKAQAYAKPTLVFKVVVTPSEKMTATGTSMVGNVASTTDISYSSLFTVEVEYADQGMDAAGKPIPRKVRLARRISHA